MVPTKRSLLHLRAADIMSRNVTMIPGEMSLQCAAHLLRSAGVTGAPIVDDAGHCIGVLSATDFMHSVDNDAPRRCVCAESDGFARPWQMPAADEQQKPACVTDYMTKDPVLVQPDMLVKDIAQLMVDAHIHRVVVVDTNTKRPLGIVSSLDILAAVAREAAAPPAPPLMDEYEARQDLPAFSHWH